jgi:hypothetical protein
MSSLQVNTLYASTANTVTVFKDYNNVEMGQLCKAWVNFNGTGTIAIRGSFNVSSLTDGGTGIYTVNYTRQLPDANYAVVGLASCTDATSSSQALQVSETTVPTTSAVTVTVNNAASGKADREFINVAIFD